MNINKLPDVELNEWVHKALLEYDATINGEFSPTTDKKHCWELMDFFDISILRVPNSNLYQCRADCGNKNEDVFIAYNKDKMAAVCMAAVGFVFDSLKGPRSYEEMCEVNQNIIEEEMGGD